MISRRLLIGGSGSVTLPSVFSLGQTGFWNNIAEPRAFYYNGQTYVSYIKDTGHIYAAQWDNAARTLSTPVDLATTTSPDGVIHNSPAILVRDSDKRIVPVASEDSASAEPAYWISTNPEDATAFGATQLIAPALVSPTYPSIHQLTAVANQPIYYFLKRNDSGTFHLGYYESTDDGATWASWVSLIKPDSTSSQYHRIWHTTSRIDIFTTNTNRVDAASSVYHLYISGTNLYQTDGTLIGAVGSGPYFASAGTLVKDASGGTCWSEGGSYSGSNPATVLLTYDSANTRNNIHVARWTGSAWQVDFVAHSNGIIDSNKFIAGACIDKTTPDTVYANIKVGGHFELHRFTSPDSGTTWIETAITSGSSSDNAMPDTPASADARFRVIWGLGTYTSDSSFSFTMQGYGV